MTYKTKQKELYYLNYYKYKIDGVFGTKSREATKEFQSDYGLKPDGIFGTNTTNCMLSLWKKIQYKLNFINKSNLVIDGIVGTKTIEQIKIFQKDNDLSIDGIVGENTLNLLNKIYDNSVEIIKPMFPVNYIRITQKFDNGNHNGIDFGPDKSKKDLNMPIICPLDMKIVENTYGSDAGNYVVGISTLNEENDILFRFLHLNSIPNIKVGDNILKGNEFAKMGTTGKSTGIHLHFEVWIVPKNYEYKFSQRYSYLQNPLNYIYIYSNQVVSPNNTYDLLYF